MFSFDTVRRSKTFWAMVLAVLIAVAGYMIFRLLNPSVGFTYYEPAYLPPSTSIKARRISKNAVSASVEQDFRTVDWVYGIEEYKSASSIGMTQQNYNQSSVQPTCSILSSPAHQIYRLCHWVDYGKINVHEVTFVNGDTFIRSEMPTSLSQRTSIQEIEKYVDSFYQKSTVGFPVLSSNV